MSSIAEIEDRLAIQELMARYNFAIDFGDVETYLACFTEDGGFSNVYGSSKGQVALRQYISERTAERQERPLRHMATNIVIEVKGDRASARCYLLLLQVTPEGLKLLTTGVYKDELQKIGGAWRFSHRRVEFDTQPWVRQVFPASYLEGSGSAKPLENST